MTKAATVTIPLALVLVAWLAFGAASVTPRNVQVVDVQEPRIVVPRALENEAEGVVVAPGISEIRWGDHAWARHGTDADRVIENLRACGNLHAYFCDGPTTKDSYYIYICQFPGSPGTCGGAIVGRMAVGFTAYPSTCSWWFGKTEGCLTATAAGG